MVNTFFYISLTFISISEVPKLCTYIYIIFLIYWSLFFISLYLRSILEAQYCENTFKILVDLLIDFLSHFNLNQRSKLFETIGYNNFYKIKHFKYMIV